MTDINQTLRNAMDILYRDGVKGLSEQVLIKKIGWDKDTFKEYFRDKEDFLCQAVELYMTDQKEAQQKILAGSDNAISQIMSIVRHSIEQLKDINPAYFIQIQYLYPSVWNIYRQQADMYFYYLFYDLINEAIRQKLFRQDVNIEIVTKVLMELVKVLLNSQLFPQQRYNLSEVFRGIFLYYIKGICTDQGNLLLDEYFARESF